MPIRPRFRFRLRTLFVVVTVLGVCLGWQVKMVRDRAAVRRELVSHGASVYPLGALMHGGPISDSVRRGDPSAELSWLRRALGDEIVSDILFPGEPAADDLAKIDHFLPESRVLENVVFYDSTLGVQPQPLSASLPPISDPAAQSLPERLH
ncbi:MAG: hypothetical protein WD845_11630 [Pirellulales bacterium]